MLAVYFLCEMVMTLPSHAHWLPVFDHYSLLPILLSRLDQALQVGVVAIDGCGQCGNCLTFYFLPHR